jgi:cleavage and polyadenylation specificity factor subunit 1
MSRELPFTKVVQNRLYTGVAFDKPSQSYIAIASYEAPFEIFDEQGDPIDKANQGLLEPTATRSTLELIEPGTWRTVDGFEFRQYETALSIQSVTLETRSTTSGYRDFIAVGTIISRGEDLTAKGAVSR